MTLLSINDSIVIQLPYENFDTTKYKYRDYFKLYKQSTSDTVLYYRAQGDISIRGGGYLKYNIVKDEIEYAIGSSTQNGYGSFLTYLVSEK